VKVLVIFAQCVFAGDLSAPRDPAYNSRFFLLSKVMSSSSADMGQDTPQFLLLGVGDRGFLILAQSVAEAVAEAARP
jgi:hypothetical protein